jgi:hypothetical protein
VTQQYLVGEFSSLLAGLQPAPDESFGDAVGKLRHEVEFSPLRMLPRLAHEALELTDLISWAALEHGDAEGFRRCATTATALRDFAVDANLLP